MEKKSHITHRKNVGPFMDEGDLEWQKLVAYGWTREAHQAAKRDVLLRVEQQMLEQGHSADHETLRRIRNVLARGRN